ncbi:MAG: hypothetical protein ACOX4W_05470 [Bacilli bacterium]
MKKQEIKKIINEGMKSSIPNITDKIDLKTIVFEAPIEETALFKPNAFLKLLPRLSFIFIAVLAIVAIISVDRVGKGKYAALDATSMSASPLSHREELYSFTSISSSFLLKLSLDESNLGPMSATSSSTVSLEKKDLKFLNSYLNIFEIIIGSKDDMNYQLLESERPEYQEKIIFSATDLLGNEVSYTIYYTNDYSQKNKIIMNGSLEIGSVEFRINSIQNLITNQFQMLVFAETASNQNYVKLMSYLDGDIQKLSYELYKDSNLIHKSILDLKGSDNLELVLKISQDTYLKTFNISKIDVEGIQKFKVGYEIENLYDYRYDFLEEASGDAAGNIMPSSGDKDYTTEPAPDDSTAISVYSGVELFIDPFYNDEEMNYLYKYSFNIQDFSYEFYGNRFVNEDENYDASSWYEGYFCDEDSILWYKDESWYQGN